MYLCFVWSCTAFLCLSFSKAKFCHLLSFPTDALNEACEKIRELIPEFNNKVIQQIAGRSIQALDATKNIPRMYRRTNKEVIIELRFFSTLHQMKIFLRSFSIFKWQNRKIMQMNVVLRLSLLHFFHFVIRLATDVSTYCYS